MPLCVMPLCWGERKLKFVSDESFAEFFINLPVQSCSWERLDMLKTTGLV